MVEYLASESTHRLTHDICDVCGLEVAMPDPTKPPLHICEGMVIENPRVRDWFVAQDSTERARDLGGAAGQVLHVDVPQTRLTMSSGFGRPGVGRLITLSSSARSDDLYRIVRIVSDTEVVIVPATRWDRFRCWVGNLWALLYRARLWLAYQLLWRWLD